MYLIDTDILIYALKGDPIVVNRIRQMASQPKAVSVISYGELLYGAMKSHRRQESLARARRVAELFPIVDVTKAVVETFGSVKAEMESEGARVDDCDLLIASTALTLGYRLVTNNERHFRLVPGVKIENWSHA